MEQEDRKTGRVFEDGSGEVVDALVEVHRHLGPGLLESTYEACLAHELALRGLRFKRQRAVPVRYKAVSLDCGYRLDFVVEGEIVVELKAVDHLTAVHVAQVLTYLKLTALPVALLVNFNVPMLKQGLRRLTRKSTTSFPSSCLPVSPSEWAPRAPRPPPNPSPVPREVVRLDCSPF
jgi:GxxExxY protein